VADLSELLQFLNVPFINSFYNRFLQLGQDGIIRLVNSSAESYRAMHLHGYTFKLVSEDGHHLAKPIPMNVLSLAPEETADFEFTRTTRGIGCSIVIFSITTLTQTIVRMRWLAS
jgi:FtsP/CotA-like multicopper oxidase with cupredoxin domain